MGAIKREMNNTRWFWIAIGYQCGLAYVVSLCVYQIGNLITTGAFGIGTVVAFLLIIGFIYLLFRPYKESFCCREIPLVFKGRTMRPVKQSMI
jgi:ferrous iron transport protein B